MAISFSFKNNLQYIKLDGILAVVEEAAIRLKLDQKIIQGRRKILVDITGLKAKDKETVLALQSILKFAITRGAAIGLFGLKQSSWVLVAENFPTPLKMFEIENEAVKWIETVEIDAKPATLAEKKDPEAEFKEKKVKELLAKYEIYQVRNDYDPYLLKKLEEEYRRAPTREPLFALRRAYKNMNALKETITQIDAHCRQLADELLEITKTRKMPLSNAELSAKQKAVQEVRASVEADVNEVKSQIDQYMGQAVDYRKRMGAHDDKWRAELGLLQKQVDEKKLETNSVLALLGNAPNS